MGDWLPFWWLLFSLRLCPFLGSFLEFLCRDWHVAWGLDSQFRGGGVSLLLPSCCSSPGLSFTRFRSQFSVVVSLVDLLFLECSSFSFFVSRFPTLCCVGSLLPLAGFFSFPWFWTCCLFLCLVLHQFACFLPAFGFQVFYRPLPLLSNPLRRYTTVVSCVCVTFFLLLLPCRVCVTFFLLLPLPIVLFQ